MIPAFERFTERARQVVVLAQEEARELGHHVIGTEHILLGLRREEGGLAGRVLETLDIELDALRAEVVRICGADNEKMQGQIPFTPRAKKVLELALREALSLGHNYIGTEHILLGLVRENEGIAARILLDADVDSQAVRNETIHLLSGPRSGSAPSRPTRHQYLVVVEIDEIGEVDAEVERIQAAIKEALDTRPARMPSVKVVHLDPSTRLDTPNRRTHRRG